MPVPFLGTKFPLIGQMSASRAACPTHAVLLRSFLVVESLNVKSLQMPSNLTCLGPHGPRGAFRERKPLLSVLLHITTALQHDGWLFREFFVSIMAAEASGRVLKYNSRTNQTEVLMRGLHFPNGLSLSKDQTFIIFASCAGRLRRYWLKGPKAGTSDIFAILPGYADNVRANDEGEFWVALYCRRNAFSHVLGMYPQLRKVILRLPIPIKYQHLAFIGGKLHGIIAKYSTNGDLLDVLEDSDGKVVKAISHVEERDGKLWIGSVVMPYIATLKL